MRCRASRGAHRLLSGGSRAGSSRSSYGRRRARRGRGPVYGSCCEPASGRQFLALASAVRHDQPGAQVATVRDRCSAADCLLGTGLGPCPAVVAVPRRRPADHHNQACVGVDDHLVVGRVAIVLRLLGDCGRVWVPVSRPQSAPRPRTPACALSVRRLHVPLPGLRRGGGLERAVDCEPTLERRQRGCLGGVGAKPRSGRGDHHPAGRPTPALSLPFARESRWSRPGR